MPIVVIDLGADASSERVAWVLDACNAAIGAGRCVTGVAPGEPPPRAVAIVRVRDDSGRVVRIEVGERERSHAEWSLRELEFEAEDPPAERWRSVGLALATLLGELDPDDEIPTPAADAAPAQPPAPEPPEELPAPAPEPPDSDAERTGAELRPIEAAPSFAPKVERPRAFIGLGVLTGQGTVEQAPRWGGGLAGGWLAAGGLSLTAAGDYSTLTTEQGRLELTWLRLSAGIGYRFWLSERWSLGGGLHLGARRLGVDLESTQGLRQSAAWSPLASARVDAWWQALPFGGLALGAELSSIGRRTRVLGPEKVPITSVPLSDVTGFLSVWWAL